MPVVKLLAKIATTKYRPVYKLCKFMREQEI